MTTKRKVRVGLVVPHIFVHRDILPNVIFSPGWLALDLAHKLRDYDVEVTLFTPGPTITTLPNVTADLSLFEAELAGRGDDYMDLLRKHPFTFVTLSRQVQAELIAKAYKKADASELDVVHIYTNEEDIALPFASLCKQPVVFTHHDPFNFLVRYKNVFPKYSHLPWISLSYAQRSSMPQNTNWVANIYHGIETNKLQPTNNPTSNYVAYMGRIIEPKGVHLAIDAVKNYNKTTKSKVKLKIAGKHYSGQDKNSYWENKIKPELNDQIEYVGFLKKSTQKQNFVANARALIVPSVFEEPFGMVTIESLACGTPVIGLRTGATAEIVDHGKTGIIIDVDSPNIIDDMTHAIDDITLIDRKTCRHEFEKRFTVERMTEDHAHVYRQLVDEVKE